MADGTLNPPGESPAPESKRAQWLLAIGAAIGLAAASFGLMTPGSGAGGALSEDMVARVNGNPISRLDYDRLLAGLAADTRNPIDDKARRHVLDRMIDEELLVQRAVDLGLVDVDRRVRADLTSNLIESVVASAEETQPTRAELEAFYEENGKFFAQPGRYRVRQVYFRLANDEEEDAHAARVVAAVSALHAKRKIADVRRTFGDAEVSPIPDALLPASKLREYVGPSVTEVAMGMEIGEVSDPVRSGMGLHILQLVDSLPTVSPAFDDVAKQIEAEWTRRRGDRALRSYLDGLREDGDVTVTDTL